MSLIPSWEDVRSNTIMSDKKAYNIQHLMFSIHRVLKKFGIHYFAVAGTALGALRCSSLIPWDNDLDIGMTIEDVHSMETNLEVLNEFKEYGIEMKRNPGNNSPKLILVNPPFKSCDEYDMNAECDIFMFKYVRRKRRYYLVSKWNYMLKGYKAISADRFRNIVEVDWCGSKINMLQQSDIEISNMYGKNWMKPLFDKTHQPSIENSNHVSAVYNKQLSETKVPFLKHHALVRDYETYYRVYCDKFLSIK